MNYGKFPQIEGEKAWIGDINRPAAMKIRSFSFPSETLDPL
jgi:hypothetical protein